MSTTGYSPSFLPTPARTGKDFGAPGLLNSELQKLIGSLGNKPTVAAVYGVPGSGKTTQLAAFFTQLVRGQVAAENILVIAATRDAASRLRDELALSLQSANEGSLARTISSLAFALVRHHALATGLPLPELISGSEQDAILERLIEPYVSGQKVPSVEWPKHFDAKVMQLAGFRAELRDLLAACQEHALEAKDLAKLAVEHAKPEWVMAAELFSEYELVLGSAEFLNRFDSPSLLSRAIELLKDSEVASLVANYRVILVDDAQELTPSAAKLLKVLAAKSCSLILFGDPDSSTLGFRAADPKIMTDLAQQVWAGHAASTVNKIFLNGQGSSAESRDGQISRLMAKATKQIDPAAAGQQRAANFSAELAPSPNFIFEVLKSAEAEAAWLARQLREKHLYQGVAWQDMAVVSRSRSQLEGLELALAAQSVPVRISGAQSALRDEFGAFSLLRVAELAFAEKLEIEQVLELLESPFCGLDNLGLRRLRRALRIEAISAESNKNTDELLVELFDNSNSLTSIRTTEARTVRKFLKRFEFVRSVAGDSSKSIEDLLWAIWFGSDPQEHWPEAARGIGEIAVQANRNLDSVLELFAAANRYVERAPSASAWNFIRVQLDQRLPEDSLVISNRGRKTVDLLTPSALNGRRYQVVALPQLIEGVWPNLKPRSSLLGANLLSAIMFGRISEVSQVTRTELADELRMFYKAVGATNETLILSAAETEDEQISQFMNLAAGHIPAASDFEVESLTLRGLAGRYRRLLATETDPSAQANYAAALGRLASAGVAGAHPDSWYGLAPLSTEEPLFEIAVSAGDGQTELEKIQIHPSELEAFVTCPLHWFLSTHGAGDYDFSASLGSLVHKALEIATTTAETDIWQVVESKWHTLRFESEWLETKARRQAKEMVAKLVGYLSDFDSAGGKLAGAEQRIDFELGQVQISGRVDRVEVLPNGRVLIVDLKTGKNPPAIADMPKHPQLGLYQLAWQKQGFVELQELPPGTELGGAKLVFVGGDKLTTRDQTSISIEPELEKYFEKLVAESAKEMAMPQKIYVANVSSHCEADRSYGSCKLHLVKAVSYAG